MTTKNMSNKVRVSVIIVTRNRQKKLAKCLTALAKGFFKNFELIIVDQGNSKKIEPEVQSLLSNFHKVIYEFSDQKGKSKGLNLAIKVCSADVLAFTDDDCLPDRNWLKNILESFNLRKNIVAVFGQTLPHQAENNKNLVCPSIFTSSKEKLINQECRHWIEIGFGNNMAWRKSFYIKHGLFKEWLGPGSIGSGAEDAEISLRALINRETILYNPKMIVKHDKWLSSKQLRQQELSYLCGEMACYGHLAIKGNELGKKVVLHNIRQNFTDLKNIIRSVIKLKKESCPLLFSFFLRLLAQLRGLIVAFVYR